MLFAQGPFYDGKTIRIIVGYPAGTTHDTWARLAAQYMSKYIPGNPGFIVQSMTGAGSMVAANYVYSIAKPDGLTLGTFNAALYFEQLIGRKEVQFDWPKITWIGSSTPATRLFWTRPIRNNSRSNRFAAKILKHWQKRSRISLRK
jgi:tripartite-type tricarboxylate transporter receptor subunit TctC